MGVYSNRWLYQPGDTYLNAALSRLGLGKVGYKFSDNFEAGAKRWTVYDESVAVSPSRLTMPAANYGGVVLSTTASANTSTQLVVGDRHNSRHPICFPNTKKWYVGFRMKQSAPATNMQAFLNFMSPDLVTSYGYLGYLSGLGGNDICYFNGAGTVLIDGNVAASTTSRVIELESSGSLITMRIDGAVVGTSATIPSDSTMRFEVNNGATAATRTFELNWVRLAFEADESTAD